MAKEQLDSIEIKIELCRMLKELDEYLGGHGIQYSCLLYTSHEEWMKNVTSGNYQKYYEEMYKAKAEVRA